MLAETRQNGKYRVDLPSGILDVILANSAGCRPFSVTFHALLQFAQKTVQLSGPEVVSRPQLGHIAGKKRICQLSSTVSASMSAAGAVARISSVIPSCTFSLRT